MICRVIALNLVKGCKVLKDAVVVGPNYIPQDPKQLTLHAFVESSSEEEEAEEVLPKTTVMTKTMTSWSLSKACKSDLREQRVLHLSKNRTRIQFPSREVPTPLGAELFGLVLHIRRKWLTVCLR